MSRLPQWRTPASLLSARHHQVAQGAGAAGDEAQRQRLRRLEGRDPVQQRTRQAGGQRAQQPGAIGKRAVDLARHRPPAQPAAGRLLHHLRRGGHDDEEEHQEGAAPGEAREVQQQQRRRVAEAVDADHDAPLDLGVALQEALRVAGQRRDDRDRQEGIDRDEDREQVEAPQADEQVLQRQHDEEGQHQAAVVAAPRVHQGDELAQRQRTTARRTAASRPPARRSRRSQNSRRRSRAHAGRARSALRPSALVLVAHASTAAAPRWPSDQQAEQGHEEQRDLLVDRQRAQPASRQRLIAGRPGAAPAPRRARGRGRRACPRRAASCSGAPKVARAQDRHRHHLALGHHALHVVDPGRHQRHVRELLGQVVQAALEGLRLALVAARALGKDDQRVAVAQRLDQRLQRVLVVAALRADIDGIEDLARDPVLEAARGPVVARGDRPRAWRAARAAARPRSAPSRGGSGGWRSRCAARPSAGSPASGPARR